MKIKIYIILLLFIISSPLFLLFTTENIYVSQTERRELAKLPKLTFSSYLSGSWSNGIDKYIDDHFPFRQNIIYIASIIRHNMGFQIKDRERILYIPRLKGNANYPDDLDSASKINYLTDFNEAMAGNLLVLNGCIYTLNSGSPTVAPAFSKMLSDYALQFEGKVRVFSCVAPLSSAFIPVERYARYNGENKKTLDAIRDNLTNGAIFCDVLGELNKHPNEKLFFGSDHHWTALGAYYAYISFCEAAGFEAIPLESMTYKYKYPFLGTLYEQTRDKTVRDNPDTMKYYMPDVFTVAERYNAYNYNAPCHSEVFCEHFSGGGSYSTFLCGDAPLIKITTDTRNGKKAVVIKNSMGNAFSVYLISHYEEIFVLDFRYSKHNLIDLIEKNNINDIIFALGMYGAVNHGTINMMKQMAFNRGKMPEIITLPDTVAPDIIVDSIPPEEFINEEINTDSLSETIN
ncbi:MAG: DHHW family protein [Bacteroidales bacterium]|nr:DHHW family protein [Bacteroidales bacterium]